MKRSNNLLLIFLIFLNVSVTMLMILVILGFLPWKNWIGILAIILCALSLIFIYKKKGTGRKMNCAITMENDMKELIEQKTGQTVLIDSTECSKRKEMLGSESCCKGCPSELPCSKMIGADLLRMKMILYKPKNFSDYMKQKKYFTSSLDKIIEAKTLKKLKKIVKELT